MKAVLFNIVNPDLDSGWEGGRGEADLVFDTASSFQSGRRRFNNSGCDREGCFEVLGYQGQSSKTRSGGVSGKGRQ